MRLVVMDGNRRREFTPADAPVNVGRLPSLQVQVSHPLVSRQHGCFCWQDEKWVYQDRSRHGTLCRTPGAGEHWVREGSEILPDHCELFLAGPDGYRLSCDLETDASSDSVRQIYCKAIAAQERGDLAAAIECFLELARREPPVMDALRRVADCLALRGSLPEALAWATRYALRRPGDPDGWKLLARLHGQSGAVDEACDCLRRARALDASDPELTELERRIGSYGEAAAVMQQSTIEVLGSGMCQTLETKHFRIEYDFARYGRLLPDLAKGLEAAVERCAGLLPVPQQPICVTIVAEAPTEHEAPALGDRSAAAACDTGGIRIFLPPHLGKGRYDTPFLVSLALHEVAHAVLLQGSAAAPWWVHEGLAQFLSLGERAEENIPAPSQAPSLQNFETLPPAAARETGYALAYFAILALKEGAGSVGLAAFIEGLCAGGDAAQVLETCGWSYERLSQSAWQRWRRSDSPAPIHLVTLGEIPERAP